ncbi:hypothetical protein AAFF_G00363630 [Aldrovandia affinis]|uniref:Uncharacterized protein n=1 Tax=Aldrovandia affinis TaxID=143900 RepID=A0AAD7SHJ5_9TELE|nr:hypothetical protein AAFF_G00363630 [Aldrovandia affinis]
MGTFHRRMRTLRAVFTTLYGHQRASLEARQGPPPHGDGPARAPATGTGTLSVARRSRVLPRAPLPSNEDQLVPVAHLSSAHRPNARVRQRRGREGGTKFNRSGSAPFAPRGESHSANGEKSRETTKREERQLQTLAVAASPSRDRGEEPGNKRTSNFLSPHQSKLKSGKGLDTLLGAGASRSPPSLRPSAKQRRTIASTQ